MPQMAPMNWLILYITFSLIFFLFNFMNYYSFLVKNKINNKFNKINKTFMYWKW